MKWFLGVFALLLAALVLESGLLAYAMYVLLGLLLLSRYLARSWIANLEAVRKGEHAATAEIGQSVQVRIALYNRGWLPVPWVLLETSCRPAHWQWIVRGSRSRDAGWKSA